MKTLKVLAYSFVSASCLFPASGRAQTPDSIYLLNGTSHSGSAQLDVVNLTSGLVSQGAVLSTAQNSAESILLDYDARSMALVQHGSATAFSLNNPASLTTILTKSTFGNGTPMFSGFTHFPDGSPGLLLGKVVTSGNSVNTELFEFSFNGETKSQSTTNAAISDLRTSGTYGTIVPDSPVKDLYLTEDNGKIRYGRNSFLPMPAPPLPKEAQASSLILEVNTAAEMILSSLTERTFSRTALGSKVFHIYSNKSWSSITVPGSTSTVRAFGPWLAFVEIEDTQHWATTQGPGYFVYDSSVARRSPGKEGRMETVLPGSNTGGQHPETTDDLFETMGLYLPGTLMLYNVETAKRYSIATNQGDSEILLVNGSDVYYRENISLYHATIDGDALSTPVKVATNVAIGSCHRAFMTK